MEAAPFICLACGELIIVVPDQHDTLLVPPHPDRVTPLAPCTAGARAVASDWTSNR